ncbi:MAG TPA: VWA domain-containing protein [Candidatus Rifleibacterium sp.]|nr:VWA domain-containing protein [Candidatus Rifleibacterium sp.]
MKRILLSFVLLIVGLTSVAGNDFSSAVLHVNSAGFPKIGVVMKVFNKEPVEMKADNFVISEDGTAISSFAIASQKNRHYMVLVLDRSSSIEPAMNDVKRAATSFVQTMVTDVSMSVLSFGSDIDFTHSFSEDPASLIEAINKLRPWGGTALYDALYSACEELQNQAGRADLKTVVCLTDGRDSTPNGQTPMSTHKPEEVNKLAVEKGIRLITVGLGNDIDSNVLKGFASATGGWYLQTTTPEELAKIYDALGRRMKLERYYQLDYQTPKPARDGTKRNIEISSSLKGLADQGKGNYIAPTVTVHKPEAVKKGGDGKMSVTKVFHELNIEGPDTVFLTGPITPPPASPVFGLNRASLLGLGEAETTGVIEQARARVSAEHRQNYDRQMKYLDDYQKCCERLCQKVEEDASRPDIKDFERPRIEYRRQYLQLRQEEINLHKQQAYDEYQAKHQSAMDELDFYQKTGLAGGDDDEGFFERNSASATATLNDISGKYDQLFAAHREKTNSHFSNSQAGRGAHVESITTITDEEVDLPSGTGRNDMTGVGAVPSFGEIDKFIKNRIPGNQDIDEDDSGSDAGDSEDSDADQPKMPDLKILDR